MIDPRYDDRQLNMQSYCGVLTHLSGDETQGYVRFKNQSLGLYPVESLLMLVPGLMVVDRLRATDEDEIEPYELLDLMEICLLDASGDVELQKKALDKATDNPNIWFIAVLTVGDWLDNFNDLDIGPGRPAGRGR